MAMENIQSDFTLFIFVGSESTHREQMYMASIQKPLTLPPLSSIRPGCQ